MKMQLVKPLLSAAHQADDSVLLTGLHGIGKTEIAKEWAEENNVHMEVLYLSNQEVGDLIGIPKVSVEDGKEVTIWTEPSWLNRMREASKKGKTTALFLDEFSRAPLDVRQAALQLVLDRKIHQHELPITNNQKTFIIAADNPDNGDYAVESLDPALLDRFLSIPVEIDTVGWLDWASKHNVNKIVRAFIADNPSKLHFTPEEGSDEIIGATPRSWTKLSAFIDNISNIPKELHYPIITGKIGKALSAQFLNFMNNYSNMISVEDIEELVQELDTKKVNIEKMGEAVKELTEKLEVIQKTELLNALFDKYIGLSANEAKPMMAMYYSLDIEVLAASLKKLTQNDPDNFYNLSEIDNELNSRKLFIRITKNLNLG